MIELVTAIATIANIFLFSWLTLSNTWLATISFQKKNGVGGWFASLAFFFGVADMILLNFVAYRLSPALAGMETLSPNTATLHVLLAIASVFIFYFTIVKRYHQINDKDL